VILKSESTTVTNRGDPAQVESRRGDRCYVPVLGNVLNRNPPNSASAASWITLKVAVTPSILRHRSPTPGNDSQGYSDLRKITRNLSLTFAALGDTGQPLSRPVEGCG
jgi:hypothetical protein